MKLLSLSLVLGAFTTLSLAGTPIENIWAVLFAGSAGWENYRHQSDVSHAYHVLINHGVLPEKIIVLMYDDIAHHRYNPYPGQIFNTPDGPDVYNGVKIDYRDKDVNKETILNVLKGNATGNHGKGTGRVLESNSTENVFIFSSGHGGSFVIGMPDGNDLTKKELDAAFQHMQDNEMYNQVMYYLEACEAGSMFEGLSADKNIYTVTASPPDKPSFSTGPFNPKINGTPLGDVFSVLWMQNTELNNILTETIGTQIDAVVKGASVEYDQVCQYGDTRFRNEDVSEFQGKKALQKSKISKDAEEAIYKQVYSQKVSNHELPLLMVEQKMRDSGATEAEVQAQLKKHHGKRAEMKKFIHSAAKALSTNPKHAKYVMATKPKQLIQVDCHHEAINAFNKLCAPFSSNQYAIRLSGHIANLCEVLDGDAKPIVQYFQDECRDGPRFYDVL